MPLMGGGLGGGGNGTPGLPGKSAYQSALDTGAIPAGTTEAQFVASLKGAAGTPGPVLNPRGAWQPNTQYAAGDSVTYQGANYFTPTAFTSGATFNAADWVRWTDNPGMLNVTWTGGSNNSIVVRDTAGTVADVRIADKGTLANKRTYYRDANGKFWQPGSVVPGTFTAGQVGYDVIVVPKTSVSGSNIGVTPADTPGIYASTDTRGYLKVGTVEDTASWRFQPDPAWINPDNLITSQNTIQNMTAAAAPTAGVYDEIWTTAGLVANVQADATMPEGKVIRLTNTTNARRALVYRTAGTGVDQSMEAIARCKGVRSGRFLRIEINCSGGNGAANGTEMGYVLELDAGSGFYKVYKYTGSGVSGTFISATLPGGALTDGQWVGMGLKRIENVLMMRAYLWTAAMTLPAYTGTYYDSSPITTPGYMGIAVNGVTANPNVDYAEFTGMVYNQNDGRLS